MNNINSIIVSVLHLKEVSDILINIEPDISFTLLQLSKKLLELYDIQNEYVDEANEIIDEIVSNEEIQTNEK